MRYFTLIIIFFSAFTLSAQSKKIDALVKDLHNSQFIIVHPQKANFKIKSRSALKLVKTGKPATNALVQALGDSSKTIMAHWALCHIYFKQVSFAGPKHSVSRNHDLNKYYLGEENGEGLIITEEELYEDKYRIFVTSRDREKIIAYWQKKTGN